MTVTNHQIVGKQWGDRWFAMLQGFGLATAAVRTKPTTRGSRITRLEVLVGEISGEVQSPTHGVCKVTIRLAPWHNETWTHVIETLGSQPFFVTQAMAGNLPLELEQTLQQLNAPLLPTSAREIIQTCSCDTSSRQPCPELLVIHRQFSEMLNEEPWLLLRLRGRDRQQILQSLQTHRNVNGNNSALANGAATPHQAQPRETETYVHRPGSELVTSDAISLADQTDSFWGSRRQLEGFHHHIAPPSIELVLLRRLGPPTSTADGGLAYETLSALYRQVTAEALTLAYATESDEPINERTE